jgi:lipopolysaccharide export system protein LptA
MNFPFRLLAPVLLGAALSLRAATGPQSQTVVDSDSVDSQSNGRETTSWFNGHVAVAGNDIHMTCDKLKVISLRTGPSSDTIGKQDQFKYLLATGHVDIVQGDREATCGRAEILPQDDKITLTESPVVTDHGNNTVCSGTKLVMLRGERRVFVEHAHMTGPPIKDLGFDKNQPPPKGGPAQQP